MEDPFFNQGYQMRSIYNKKSPFKNCIDQFQVKHNYHIDQKVIDNIKEKYNYTKNCKYDIFKYLKDHRLSKHNKNVHAIHSEVTDVPHQHIPDDSEQQLIQDLV